MTIAPQGEPASIGVDDGSRFPRAGRRLRIGMIGAGRIAKVQAMGIRLTNRWEIVAGALSSDRATARRLGEEWYLAPDRAYASYQEMAAKEAARPDGVDAVVIVTPNDTHYPIACAFLGAGIDVISDKPLTTNLADAVDLVRRTREAGLVFGVTHAYAAYPMVRQAKAMIAAGDLGRLRQIHVEYVQEWMTGNPVAMKHVQWRQDPARSGATACTADIGTHAHHLACFVSGLELTRLRAELLVCGEPKRLDDTVYVSARYGDDVPGLLWATQVAPGNFCGLRLRIFGEKGGLQWDQENPDHLLFSPFGKSTQVIRRGFGGGVDIAAERLTRVARGNTEGWLEAWANLFTECAVAISARREGRVLPPGLVQFATVEDGARGMKFIDAVVESHAAGGVWVDCSLRL